MQNKGVQTAKKALKLKLKKKKRILQLYLNYT